MSDEEQRTGLIARTLGTIAWGLVLCVATWICLPKEFLGVTKPPLESFLIAGLWWPVLWLILWGLQTLLPFPLDLLPKLLELVLVSPGHLLAWVLSGDD